MLLSEAVEQINHAHMGFVGRAGGGGGVTCERDSGHIVESVYSPQFRRQQNMLNRTRCQTQRIVADIDNIGYSDYWRFS